VDPLDAARALLPFCVCWGDAGLSLFFALGFAPAIAWLVERIAARPLRALPPDAPWMDRARVAFPVRRCTFTCVTVSTVCFPFGAFFVSKSFFTPPLPLLAAMVATAAFASTFYVRLRSEERILTRRIGVGRALRSFLSFIVVTRWPLGIIAFAWGLVLSDPGKRDALVVCAILVVYVAGVLGGSVQFARLVGLARPASPRLARIIDRAAADLTATPSTRAGTRIARFHMKPKVFEAPIVHANALALPLANTLVFTDGALAALSDDEIGAIASHELGHLTEPRGVGVLRTVPGVLLILAAAAERPVASAFASLGVLGHLAAILITLVPIVLFARIVVRPLANRMEKRADAVAHLHEDAEGLYARALARIYEANLMPVVMGLKRAIHPDLYDRLVASGAPPAYPRPPPPDKRLVRRLVVLASFLLSFCATAPLWVGLTIAKLADNESIRGAFIALAVTGDAWHLGEVARLESAAGDQDKAAAFYAACERLNTISAAYPANRATVLARAGRCREAKVAFLTALYRVDEYSASESEEQAVAMARRAQLRCETSTEP
jgi:Zn-dependent protease with chaperone function